MVGLYVTFLYSNLIHFENQKKLKNFIHFVEIKIVINVQKLQKQEELGDICLVISI